MRSFAILSVIYALQNLKVSAIPQTLYNNVVQERGLPEFINDVVNQGLSQNREIPPNPDRPSNVDKAAFHGSRFDFFPEIAHKFGFVDDGSNPALVHVPVWLYGRIGTAQTPCYAEGATNGDGTGPNPGTDGPTGPAGINPGQDCTDPGDYHGDYTEGKPFPVYVGSAWCGGKAEWRINYAVYYVHDGIGSGGHKHDWEGVTVIFKKDPNAGDQDWWMASGVSYRTHDGSEYRSWKDLQTVNGRDDIREEKTDNAKKHPKVYVGLRSHASFPDKCDTGCGSIKARRSDRPPPDNGHSKDKDYEYRSSDWWRLPNGGDLKLYDTLKKEWDSSWKGMNTPWVSQEKMCTW